MSTSVAGRLTGRIAQFFRSRRVRTVIFIVGAYKVYTTARTYNVLYKVFNHHHHLPGQTILDLDLDKIEIVSHDSFNPLGSNEEIRLQKLITTIESAKADPRVTGLVVRGLGGLSSVGLAEICELRNVIQDFSKGWGGKQTMLHVPEGLGGVSNGTVPLYFASGFDSVHVQPTSAVITPGLSGGTLFFKKMLEHIGIKAKKVARKEYKTAANSFTEEKFTEPHKESTEALLKAVMSEIVTQVAAGRHISEDRVTAAIDVGVMCAKEAEELGIIDESLYRDELPNAMRTRLRHAAENRAESRTEIIEEWRNAMQELKQVWVDTKMDDEIWANGDVLQNTAEFETAVPGAMLFADERQDWVKKTNTAELRALKAHLRWLESRPWEEVSPKDAKHSVFFTTSNISSILQVEKRLCEDAIRSLEGCPTLLESLRKDAEDENVLQLNMKSSLSLIRWCRGMWRAKCLASRIVGTLQDSDEQLKEALSSTSEDDKSKNKLEDLAHCPRVFLIGFSDALRNRIPHNVAKAEVKQAVEKDNAHLEADEVDSAETVLPANEERSQEGRRMEPTLRHVRLSDYVELLHSEKRAVHDSSQPFVRFESANPLQKLPGTIDSQERKALARLQLPGHRFAPWRMSVPKGDIVAVINIHGPITDEGADTTRAAIRRADKDPYVKGIVLRIESPGGSATASDLISRAIEVAEKPIVASMGSVCASGGYFISAPCDKVLASNMTITGSIGVIFSIFNTAGLFEKLGITSDSVETARFSKYYGAQGTITEWSEEFSTRVNSLIDNFYSDFVSVVAKGRGMGYDKAEQIARGRVWAGSDALALGLVDEIGGLQEAIHAAGELACLAPDAEIRAVDYPTMAMKVADAARRRGLIPSHLNEEGDEATPERGRRWLWAMGRQTPDDNRDEKPDEPQSIQSILMPMWSYEYEDFYQVMFSRLLLQLDRFLLTSSAPTPVTSLVEKGLRHLLGNVRKDQVANLIAEELERTRATAGRAAAIAPHIQVDG
ncbi:unnamed protein product [Chondrus crispus]|uniref:Peptidase S49 domain-containing protein n=1 Tax=Chondrus crispus TaxID=2769 RepID=R7QN19_CHOCR|nr:unnamed protein product [Chondrus crispus]CDF39902.1 unnamed protein product [Chondrus crispus]|eukprot:XP_005710196.1 unnamed protein product [Chondrus crispus]